MARRIVLRARHPRVFFLADQPLGLSTTQACVQRSRLTVSTDSGSRHVAAALGKQVVTLFGPTSPVWTKNPTVRGADLQLELDCVGCGKRACPRGDHKCMRDLSVEMVHAEIERLLEDEARVHAA